MIRLVIEFISSRLLVKVFISVSIMFVLLVLVFRCGSSNMIVGMLDIRLDSVIFSISSGLGLVRCMLWLDIYVIVCVVRLVVLNVWLIMNRLMNSSSNG